MRKLELWGGHECTVNRVGDRFGDQTERTGHGARASDLELFAGLGISALRYPVLWERVAPDDPGVMDWSWPHERLARLRRLNIRPIVGLIHHGSGPKYTDLLSPGFAPGLARFAAEAAARFDWVEDWTPVNEPLTTARFSALYGHWYPHHRDERSFWLALLNQIDAVRLSMAAIRRIVPHARLIQTEDLGRTWSTAPMRDQAGFDNTRRWMTWDLLCGRVLPDHPLWERIVGFGFGDRLREIADAPCPPNVLGVNHYITSDRFLDHRFRRYPPAMIGHNATRRFADVEAVRVLEPPPRGLSGAMHDAWSRYRIPLAATEIHNGSTREEQMRWFDDAWQTALRLRRDGVDIRAVTSWALLGSQGWNTLLTGEGRYEAGVFDVSGGTPRATALADQLRGLGGVERHPALDGPGWWLLPQRLQYRPAPHAAPLKQHLPPPTVRGAPILIVGDNPVAAALVRACGDRNITCASIARGEDVAAALDRDRPWVVIDTDETPSLAHACFERDVPLTTMSGDFDNAALDRVIDGARDPLHALSVA